MEKTERDWRLDTLMSSTGFLHAFWGIDGKHMEVIFTDNVSLSTCDSLHVSWKKANKSDIYYDRKYETSFYTWPLKWNTEIKSPQGFGVAILI